MERGSWTQLLPTFPDLAISVWCVYTHLTGAWRRNWENNANWLSFPKVWWQRTKVSFFFFTTEHITIHRTQPQNRTEQIRTHQIRTQQIRTQPLSKQRRRSFPSSLILFSFIVTMFILHFFFDSSQSSSSFSHRQSAISSLIFVSFAAHLPTLWLVLCS